MLPDWDRCFPDCEPVGYHLRAAFAARWVRFHSLPGSKRYPENDNEYAEVLARHNVILGELAHPGEKIVLVTTGYSESPVPSRSYPGVVAFDPSAVPWRTVAMHQIEGEFTEPNYWHLFSSVWEWRPGEFDPLIRLVADDAVANVLIVAQDCRWALHPYDGGMDVIAESAEKRRSLRASHSEWLPARADGL
ncbi:MAG TPA: hypothetical protein DDY78_06965 [Planctomycetales bacterium]|jgi:hypothetical protein|nr:hypothetical protein [Planctomycetales bacterium]